MIDAIMAADPGMEVHSARKRAELNQEQFLEILVKELTTQNPLEPMDNSQFLQQLVGLQTLEQTSALTDALKTFERFMQMNSAAGLIGKGVKGVDGEGAAVTGVVSKVVMDGGKVLLQIGSHRVPVHGVQEII